MVTARVSSRFPPTTCSSVRYNIYVIFARTFGHKEPDTYRSVTLRPLHEGTSLLIPSIPHQIHQYIFHFSPPSLSRPPPLGTGTSGPRVTLGPGAGAGSAPGSHSRVEGAAAAVAVVARLRLRRDIRSGVDNVSSGWWVMSFSGTETASAATEALGRLRRRRWRYGEGERTAEGSGMGTQTVGSGGSGVLAQLRRDLFVSAGMCSTETTYATGHQELLQRKQEIWFAVSILCITDSML